MRFKFSKTNHLKGFTLVELMTVVVIIGIISTVAIPGYQKYTLNSKMAEATVTMSAIQKSEVTYHSQNDYFISLFRSTNQRPPSKRKAEYLDITVAWERIGYPVIAENDYFYTYSSLAGGTYANGTDQVMGMGTPTPIMGSWDGTIFTTSRAIDSGNCNYTVDYSSFGLNQTTNERWVILFASTDFVKTTPIVCSTVVSVVRMAQGNLTMSPLLSMNAGE